MAAKSSGAGSVAGVLLAASIGVVALAVAPAARGASSGLVSAGYEHTCAVIDGGVQCWGSNTRGQLGDGGASESSLVPIDVVGLGPHSGVSAIAAGGWHTCAVVNEGLKCWGYNEDGELGIGDSNLRSSPVEILPEHSGVTAVAGGYYHTCAVVNGGAKCWGDNEGRQLGNDSTIDSLVPVDVMGLGEGSGTTAIAAGYVHSCAIAAEKLWCWGANADGELGIGSTTDHGTPQSVFIMETGVTDVDADDGFTCAIRNETDVYCWGRADAGQLGSGDAETSYIPRQITNIPNGVRAIAARENGACAISNTEAFCWGGNTDGQLGNGSTIDSLAPVSVSGLSSGMRTVTAGGDHVCVRYPDGRLYCWGYDYNGQLGDGGQPVRVPYPTESASLTGISGLSAGGAHACGTINATPVCWGGGWSGRLGSGTENDYATPTPVLLPLDFPQFRVRAGQAHTCGVAPYGGQSFCWGNNDYGQLGDGTHTTWFTPTLIPELATTGKDIAAGQYHSCAASVDAHAYCWGDGRYGALGAGNFVSSDTPIRVRTGPLQGETLDGVVSVTTGGYHSCALVGSAQNGSAWCWGEAGEGQLGNGSRADSAYAVLVSGLDHGVSAIVAGDSHTCALVDGAVKCWGENWYHQLGALVEGSSDTPVSVHVDQLTQLTGATAVSTGAYHSCAVADGGVRCWGYNSQGQIGNGTFADAPYAVSVIPPNSGVTEVAAGLNFTCAASPEHTWCWGNGYNGRLGNGELGYSTVPVTVKIDHIFGNDFELQP